MMITEALAEIKTIGKRIEKKREFIGQFLGRQDGVRDPLEKDGGSAARITAERQAVADLEARVVALRRGIQTANEVTMVTISAVGDGSSLKVQTRSIADWLIWRRDVAPGQKAWLARVRQQLAQIRDQAKKQGAAIISATANSVAEKPTDFVINISEAELAAEAESLEDILGQLDGQLSLKNATVSIYNDAVATQAPPPLPHEVPF